MIAIALLALVAVSLASVPTTRPAPPTVKWCQVDAATKSVDCSGVKLGKVPRDLPADTLHLDLSGASLTSIDKSAFKALTGLISLSLTGNLFSSLHVSTFANQRKLEYLALDENVNLASLPEKIFASTASLIELELDNNALASLPARIFYGLHNLQSLDLDSNQFGSNGLPETVFSAAGLVDLTFLDLDSNNLGSTLPAGLFKNLPSLTTLDLNNNNLVTLPESIFVGVSTIEYLYIDDNELAYLPANVFAPLFSLLELELDDNELTSLDVALFAAQGLLQSLDLDSNNLASLTVGVFDSLVSLTFLDLDSNGLTSIDADLFAQNLALVYLDLSFNALTEITPGVFNHLANLGFLFLNDNDISSVYSNNFEGTAIDVTSAESFSFENNPIIIAIAPRELTLSGDDCTWGKVRAQKYRGQYQHFWCVAITTKTGRRATRQ